MPMYCYILHYSAMSETKYHFKNERLFHRDNFTTHPIKLCEINILTQKLMAATQTIAEQNIEFHMRMLVS